MIIETVGLAMNYRVFAAMMAISTIVAGCQTTDKTLNRTVPVSVPQKLGHYSSINRDCTSRGQTVVRIVEAPKHGKVTFQQAKDFPHFAESNVYSSCNTQRVLGTTIMYSPDAGYAGTDSVVLQAIFPNGKEVSNRYNLTVK